MGSADIIRSHSITSFFILFLRLLSSTLEVPGPSSLRFLVTLSVPTGFIAYEKTNGVWHLALDLHMFKPAGLSELIEKNGLWWFG